MEIDNSFANQNSYQDLFTSLTQYKQELTFWQSQTTTITRTKIVIPPKEMVTQVLVEEAFLEEQKLAETDNVDDKTKEIDLNEEQVEVDNEIPDEAFEQVTIKSERTERDKSLSGKGRLVSGKIKGKKKRKKTKVKRRKRMRKYKGSCPNF